MGDLPDLIFRTGSSGPMSVPLQELAAARGRHEHRGIYSVCSAHPWVIEAAMRHAPIGNGPLLIEATCNQVNQFGGYSGMTPADFRERVWKIAAQVGFPRDRILLGGDHLGPYPWREHDAKGAMSRAVDMIRLFVREGFHKIHLDTSMSCAGDPNPLPEETIAKRAALLCGTAESSSEEHHPVYVIGTEVPTPGGAEKETAIAITSREGAEQAILTHRQAFAAAGLHAAWDRVIALVVQPGVEFSHESVTDYDPSHAESLCEVLRDHPRFVFEAHSTDYQRPRALAELVRDGFAILKVGPALTFAMRQALFALATIEEECLPPARQSKLRAVIERVMLQQPDQWQKHYGGTLQEQHRLRVHSYSDRIRYYWTDPAVQQAVNGLVANLNACDIPETMLSDFLPAQYDKVREGTLKNAPLPIILDKIGGVLEPYIAACSGPAS
ncbi:MAG: D-tagatose-bisphosphate aldolase, class II, non-catalytic subunit [Terriglobales bacterium]